MKKQTKLTEKSARIPETRQTHWVESITAYLHDVDGMNKESARSHRFAMLVQELIGVEPDFIETYSAGIEKSLKVKQKDRILTGEADNLFGNVIIEFEASLAKTRDEAKEQLRRYTAILWSLDARTPYLCLATDGVRFVTYSPTLSKPAARDVSPDDVDLQVLEECDWRELQPHEIYYWLDRYFLRKEILHPTSETIVRDFGVKSHAFQTTTRALLALWGEIKARSAFAVVFDSWDKYLRVVYGSRVAGDELFIRHTYLATLAKLMAWMRITESASLPDDAQIVEMLEGELFKRQGIENFIEEDFFSWLAREGAVKVGVGSVRWLFSLLQNYNLRELSEDVLKSLYQELVDPEARHDLGEFYTPDWLAHRTVRKLLDTNPRGATLDPTCGSGTFIYLTIREKRERLHDSAQTLQHILDSVYGADIHPLAVIVAKTNYILALGDLLKKRKGAITIPIYLANTIRLPDREIEPTLWMQVPSYRVELDDREAHLPEPLFENLPLFDQAIELAKDFALQNKGKRIAPEPFRNFLAAQGFPHTDDAVLVQSLFSVADTLKNFIDIDRDTIWAFVLKNIFKPLFFKRKFDFIVGNPPWIAYHFIEQPAYQTFLKKQITENYQLLTGRGELVPSLELATVFLVRAADLYLKSGGMIAFVLPKSIFSADQHDGLRKRAFSFSEDTLQSLFWREVWDCENVMPLFKVPSCVLIADKREVEAEDRAKRAAPLPGQILRGKLERKNATLAEAEDALTIENVEFLLHTRGKRSYWATGKGAATQAASYYKSQFTRGVNAILPHPFWLVEVKPSKLGLNPDLPPVQSADWARRRAKAPYEDVFLKGTVENRFLYVTLLSSDLLPFGHFEPRLVVLPIQPVESHSKLIDSAEARKQGFLHLAHWLEQVEREWAKRRGTKTEKATVYEHLDLFGGVTRQNPRARNLVVYNKSGTFLTASVVRNGPIEFNINGQSISANGFVSDQTIYYFGTNDTREAYFLVAMLNAPIVDKLIKPMQSRGLWGPRDIHKKVFELPIPKFDAANPTHKRLAELGKECSAKMDKWLASGGAGNITSIGKLRGMVRAMLKDELQEIDALVEKIL